MKDLIDVAFKDDSPLSTVEKIKSILRKHAIEIEEIWLETKVPYCYALQLKIKGLNFTTSGKGLSRELALASAYGEMIERVQLGFLGSRTTQKDGSYSMNDGQDVVVSVDQLLEDKRNIYQKMSERLFAWTGKEIAVKDMLLQYADAQKNISATPFVSLRDGEKVFIPTQIRKALYTSNGCAAGNTLEEAIVQALSEIVERFYRLRIIHESICVPQIPEEELQKYKVPYEIITYVRGQGYNVWVNDCSLGMDFPVVCVSFVNKKTGKYHTHFGAYPVFEIALTRALTETFQGRNVDSFTKYSDFFYNNDKKSYIQNLALELTYGTSKRMPEFFVGQSKFEYNSKQGFAGKNNRELLTECIDFFDKQGYDILIRNSSGLGFPTVQIIIPGYSEMYVHRLPKDEDENRYLPYAVKTLRNAAEAAVPDMLGLLMHNAETEKYLTNPAKSGFFASAKIMAEVSKEQDTFYLAAAMAYVNYTLGKNAAASKYAETMLNLCDGANEAFLICTKRYLDLKLHGYTNEQITELLGMFHDESTVSLLHSYIDNGKNPFDAFILHCDMKCEDTCPVKPNCYHKKAQAFVALINQQAKELDIDAFCAEIQKLIS